MYTNTVGECFLCTTLYPRYALYISIIISWFNNNYTHHFKMSAIEKLFGNDFNRSGSIYAFLFIIIMNRSRYVLCRVLCSVSRKSHDGIATFIGIHNGC